MDVDHDRPTVLEPTEPPRRLTSDEQLGALTEQLEASTGTANGQAETPDTTADTTAGTDDVTPDTAAEAAAPDAKIGGLSFMDDYHDRLNLAGTKEQADALLAEFSDMTEDPTDIEKLKHAHGLKLKALAKRR